MVSVAASVRALGMWQSPLRPICGRARAATQSVKLARSSLKAFGGRAKQGRAGQVQGHRQGKSVRMHGRTAGLKQAARCSLSTAPKVASSIEMRYRWGADR